MPVTDTLYLLTQAVHLSASVLFYASTDDRCGKQQQTTRRGTMGNWQERRKQLRKHCPHSTEHPHCLLPHRRCSNKHRRSCLQHRRSSNLHRRSSNFAYGSIVIYQPSINEMSEYPQAYTTFPEHVTNHDGTYGCHAPKKSIFNPEAVDVRARRRGRSRPKKRTFKTEEAYL